MSVYQISPSSIANAGLPDAAYQINQAIFGASAGDCIAFEDAEYTLRRDYAYEQYCCISNNDASMKHIALPIIGKKDLVIDGHGASLMGIGRIMPIYLSGSENITIQNFTIDYVRPFFTQGEVLEGNDDSVLLKVDKNEYPYTIKNGVVIFEGEDYSSYFMHGILEYQVEGKRPAACAIDNMSKSPICGKEEGEGLLRLFIPFKQHAVAGNIMTIKHEERYIPGVAIDKCKNITLKNITIRHAGSMGVVGQFSENVTLDGVVVATDPNNMRMISANADATHFVNCSGKLILENCQLEGQLDDGINAHGNFLPVKYVIDNTHIVAHHAHFQQAGAFDYKKGDCLTVYEYASLNVLGKVIVAEVEIINKRHYLITLEAPFDFDPNMRYALDDEDAHPEIIFRNNRCGKNRARTVLVSSTKPILIEGNEMDAEGACVRVGSSTGFWCESGPISEIIVRNNVMKRHNYKVWGKAILDIDPDVKIASANKYFEGNILVENNVIELGGNPLVYGNQFANMTVQNNKILLKNGMDYDDSNVVQLGAHHGTLCVEGNEYEKV